MLNLAYLRENPETVVAGARAKGLAQAEALVADVLAADAERRAAIQATDELKQTLNQLAAEIGAQMKAGATAQADQLKAKTAELKLELKAYEEKLEAIEARLQQQLVQLPNVPLPEVPLGKTADDNTVLFERGTRPTLPPGAEPHWEIARRLRLIDFELGVKITGAGFPVYTHQGARLQRGLIQFFLDRAVAAGYTEYQPPLVVNEASGFGTGQLPDKEGQMYYVEKDGLYLIPTAEVPLTNLLRDEILDQAALPVRMCGYTPCFRREAGSYGAHVRGLNRLHQFDKVEIVEVVEPERSAERHEAMLAHVYSLLDALELPYRALLLCTGDMSFASAKTVDLEVYSAAQERWLEVSSVSNFLTFQAERLKLRYRPQGEKKTRILHTLNGSALALPRIVAALLENGQAADGTVGLPKALHTYLGFERLG